MNKNTCYRCDGGYNIFITYKINQGGYVCKDCNKMRGYE